MRIVLALIFTVVASPAYAQTSTASEWTNWLGCWELVNDAVRDGRSLTVDPASRRPQPPRETQPRVCVAEAAGVTGATFRTLVGDQTAVEQTIVANGENRPITDAECKGTHRAEFSRDRLRLFSAAELTCSGDETPRRVSTLALLTADGTWLDVQAVAMAGRESVRVRRYRRAAGDAAQLTPRIAAAKVTLEDVKEASGKVSSRALEAALLETRPAFPLNGRSLIELDNAGVPDAVIDLVVALTYPDRFVVERASRAPAMVQNSVIDDPYMLGWAFGHPMWWNDIEYAAPAFLYSPYFYGPFAYSHLRYYDPRFVGGGVYLDDVGGGGGTSVRPDRPSGSGRVVDGLGYTRVKPREPATATATDGSSGSTASRGGRASPQGYTGGADTSSAGSSSSGSSSGSGSSGGSSDGGRTAVPR